MVVQELISGVRGASPIREDALEEVSETETVDKDEEGRDRKGHKIRDETRSKKGKERARPREESESQGRDEEWLPSPKKRRFSEQQCDLICDYFGPHISRKRFPTAMECQEFKELYSSQFEDRTAKDIYDKCRNIAGR